MMPYIQYTPCCWFACSFQKAAVKLRFPYLDWASMRSLQYGLPDELCGLPEVSVETPFKEVRLWQHITASTAL